MSVRVIVLGGGVAGMTAAHELTDRGFQVTVYERQAIAGGKARSFGVTGTGTQGRRDLPAEHGFRFFPGFYRHLPDTMKRIPYPGNREGVFDNLVDATQMQILFNGNRHLVVPSRFPRSLQDVTAVLHASGYLTTAVGLTPDDIRFYGERVWQLLTSCDERRAEEFEGASWWDFIDAPNRSALYQAYLGRSPRVLVAADPMQANTRTVGDVLLQLLFNLADPGVSADRVLNGPTNEVWIDPWLTYLERRGVHYERAVTVTGFRCDGGRIAAVRVRQGGVDREETADYYVAALPVEKMAAILDGPMLELDPTLAGIITLAGHVDWMNGVQFYFREEVPLIYGHQMYLDSPWALTSIAQAQFWRDTTDFPRDYGDGTVKTVLSVDVSDWTKTPGSNGKLAMTCTPAEVVAEVWKQLKDSMPELLNTDLHPTSPAALDPDIQGPGPLTNAAPLLVNRPNSWALRPWARTRIPNLFLAADYVRTFTNLATMEAANEAARRAVNGILDASGSGAAPCELWDLHEPVWVKPWRWWDLVRYRRGEPWGAEPPDFVDKLAQAALEAVPAVGGSDEYADAIARAVAANGVGVVPLDVQEAIADVVLGASEAMESGDVDRLRAFFLDDAVVIVRDQPPDSTARWFDVLEAFFAAGGLVTVDVRSLDDARPWGRLIAARFTADVAVSPGEPVPARKLPGRLEVSFSRGDPKVARGWAIKSLQFVPAE
jgi:15-cis-phytoene desaturase